MSKGGNSSVQVAGSVLQAPCHACAFFSSREEEHRILLPFVKEGVERGERILQLLDRDREQERRQLLQDNGIDVEAAKEAID
ncbi:MAG TPA: MEDS domain-containing protein, partial [Stellaceae bacterium]|nr:MEDS domain-containing protein [Stellaceae bacterium]